MTGAARGQGRSHALTLAREGADIIAVELADQIGTIKYPMATPADLEETVSQVEALDCRIVSVQADVRDFDALKAAFDSGVAELGPVDIVLANAGIAHTGGPSEETKQIWDDVIGVNLTGVFNTVMAAPPSMLERDQGGAIVLTSSTQGLSGRGGDGTANTLGYAAAKHGVVGLMRSFANWLSPHNIRVNTVHPTGVSTPMVMNDVIGTWVESNPEAAAMIGNLMPVDLIEAQDISNAVLYLVSDDGRYVSGVTLPVDAGFGVK